jgi:hypothetical protein
MYKVFTSKFFFLFDRWIGGAQNEKPWCAEEETVVRRRRNRGAQKKKPYKNFITFADFYF